MSTLVKLLNPVKVSMFTDAQKKYEKEVLVNLLVSAVFLLINPLYSLFIVVLISLTVKCKINNLLIGFLYSISFALLLTNQNYVKGTGLDIEVYVSTFKGINNVSYSYLFTRYFDNVLHNEFLWYFYNKFVSILSNNNVIFFVFFTYLLIFSLSGYLTYLICKHQNYNYSFFLFCTIYVNLYFFAHGSFHLWRHIISSLIFFIGLVKYNEGISNLIPRIIMYLSPLFHVVTIPLIIIFEIYNLILFQKSYLIKFNIVLCIRIVIALILTIALFPLQDYILLFVNNISALGAALSKYTEFHHSVELSYLLRPITFLFLVSLILNRKRMLYYELFVFFIYFGLILSPLVMHILPGVIVSRLSGSLLVVVTLIASKAIVRSGLDVLFILLLLFSWRMFTLIDPEIDFILSSIGRGNLLNPFFSMFYMLLSDDIPNF